MIKIKKIDWYSEEDLAHTIVIFLISICIFMLSFFFGWSKWIQLIFLISIVLSTGSIIIFFLKLNCRKKE